MAQKRGVLLTDHEQHRHGVENHIQRIAPLVPAPCNIRITSKCLLTIDAILMLNEVGTSNQFFPPTSYAVAVILAPRIVNKPAAESPSAVTLPATRSIASSSDTPGMLNERVSHSARTLIRSIHRHSKSLVNIRAVYRRQSVEESHKASQQWSA